MTIYQAAQDKARLLDALGNVEELEIDLSAVTEMDTAGIQLLLLVKREAAAANKVMRLTAHSEAALDVIDLYNLSGYFGDQAVISSGQC